RTPAQILEQLAHVSRMVSHAKLARDQHGNTLSGPELALEAVCFGSLQEQFEQLGVLLRREAGPATRSFAAAEGLGTTALAYAAHPLRDSTRSDSERLCDLLLAPARLDEFPGAQPASLTPVSRLRGECDTHDSPPLTSSGGELANHAPINNNTCLLYWSCVGDPYSVRQVGKGINHV